MNNLFGFLFVVPPFDPTQEAYQEGFNQYSTISDVQYANVHTAR